MSEFQNEETIIFASLFMILVFLGSSWLWFTQRKDLLKKKNEVAVECWTYSWLDFSLVIWVAFVGFIAISLGLQHFVFSEEALELGDLSNSTITWPILIYGMSIQYALFFTIIGAKMSSKILFVPRAEPRSSFVQSFIKGAELLIRYLPFIWLSAGISTWLIQLLGVESVKQESVSLMLKMENNWMYLFSVISAVVVAPILEEFFFRGIILSFFVGKTNVKLAVIFSAGLFSLLHFNIDSLVPIFVLGLLLGSAYLKSGDIRISIFIHALFNGLSVMLITFDKCFT